MDELPVAAWREIRGLDQERWAELRRSGLEPGDIGRRSALAVDPGRSTGLAHRSAAGNLWTAESKSVYDLVRLLRVIAVPSAVVFESYDVAGSRSAEAACALEVIGAVDALLVSRQVAGNGSLGLVPRRVMQRPPQRLRAMGPARELAEGRSRHEVDALAHLLAWEAQQ